MPSRRAKKRIAAVAVLLALCGVAVGVLSVVRSTQQERIVQEARERGIEAYREGDYPTVLDQLGRIYLSHNREDPEILMMVAEARRNVPQEGGRHLPQAIAFARAASELNPDDPEPLELMVELYGRTGQVLEALEVAERLLEIDGSNIIAAATRVQALASLGRDEEAREAALDMSRRHEGSVGVQATVVQLLQRMGRPVQERLELAEAAADRNPENPAAWLLLAQTHLTGGDVQASIEAVREAAGLQIHEPEQLAGLLRLADAVGFVDEVDTTTRQELRALADGVLERRLARDDVEPGILTLAARRAWINEDRQRAVELAEQAAGIVAADDDQALGWAMAIMMVTEAESDKIDVLVQKLRELGTRESRAWLAWHEGIQSISEGNWSEALESFRQASFADLRNPLVLRDLARAQTATGETRRARRSYAEAIRTEPMWLAPRLALVSLLVDENRIDEAHDAAREAVLVRPRSLGASLAFGETSTRLLERGRAQAVDVPQTLRVLEAIADQAADGGQTLALLTRIHAATGDKESAQKSFDRLLEKDDLALPTRAILDLAEASRRHNLEGEERLFELAGSGEQLWDPSIIYARAARAADAGRRDEARAMFRDAIDSAQDQALKAELNRLRAAFLDRIGDGEALRELERIASEQSGSASAQLTLLRSSAAWNDGAAIRRAIERLRDIAGDDSAAWRLYEARRFLTFDADPAGVGQQVEQINEVLRSEPTHAEARELMAELLLVSDPADRTPSIDHLARAVDATPEDPRLYARLIPLLQEAGEMQRAEQYLRRLAEIDGLSPRMRQHRADLFVRQGLWEQAMDDLQAAANTGDPQALYMLAQAHEHRGQFDRAERVYRRLIESEDASVDGLISAAVFFAGRTDPSEGERLLNALPETFSEVDKKRVRAAFYARTGRPEEAAELFLAAATQAERPEAWIDLVRHNLRFGQYDQAVDALAQAREKFPNDARLRGLSRLTSILDEDSQIVRTAVAGLASTVLHDHEDPAAKELLEALADRGLRDNPDRLARRLRSITERHPGFPTAWNLLATVQLESGQADEGLRTLDTATQIFPNDVQSPRMATFVRASEGRLDEALISARRWRERTPRDTLEADSAIAEIERELGNPQRALSALQPHRARILAEVETIPQRVDLLAALHVQLGQAGRAEEILRPLADQSEAWIARTLQVGLAGAPDPQAARAWIERVEDLFKDEPRRLQLGRAWFDLALESGESSDFARTADILKPLADEAEDQELATDALVFLAPTLEELGRYEEAELRYRALIDARPDQPLALRGLADLLLREGGETAEAARLAGRAAEEARRQEAGSALRNATSLTHARALEADNKPGEAIRVLALAVDTAEGEATQLLFEHTRLLIEHNRLDDAQRALARLDESRRINAALFHAQRFEDSDKPDAADRAYRLALRFDEDNPIALKNLAYLHLQRDHDVSTQLDRARRATELGEARNMPDNARASFLNTLGTAYLKLDRPEEAEATFRRGLALNADSPYLLIGLIEACLTQGKPEEAQAEIERLERLAGEDQVPESLMNRYRTLTRQLTQSPGG